MINKAAILLAAWCALTSAIGCGTAPAKSSDVRVDLKLDPTPPIVGDSAVTLELATAEGERLVGANVRLEGNMNHAGMKPSFADLEEIEPGRYAGTLKFTMGGDWFIFVTVTTQDGQSIEKKVDVKGVQRP